MPAVRLSPFRPASRTREIVRYCTVRFPGAAGSEIWNVAVTEVGAVTVTVQVPVPEQPPPLQPAKVEPAAGVAVSVTAVPLGKRIEQDTPQLIPAGLLVIEPLPPPARVTVRA
jgi:hypothetical protein